MKPKHELQAKINSLQDALMDTDDDKKLLLIYCEISALQDAVITILEYELKLDIDKSPYEEYI